MISYNIISYDMIFYRMILYDILWSDRIHVFGTCSRRVPNKWRVKNEVGPTSFGTFRLCFGIILVVKELVKKKYNQTSTNKALLRSFRITWEFTWAKSKLQGSLLASIYIFFQLLFLFHHIGPVKGPLKGAPVPSACPEVYWPKVIESSQQGVRLESICYPRCQYDTRHDAWHDARHDARYMPEGRHKRSSYTGWKNI